MSIAISHGHSGSSRPERGVRSETMILDGGQVAFFPSLEMVPEGWRHRARSGYLVSLLPGEAEELFGSSGPVSQLGPEDLESAHLVAAGLSAIQISRLQQISLRSAERRIARLRETCGVSTTAELVAFLARRGF